MVMSGLKEMRDLQEKLRKEEEDRKKAKRQGPREWDRGKEGIEEVLGRSSDGPRVLSQKEWVEKLRKEEEDRKKVQRQGPREWDRGKEGIEEVLGRSSDGPRVLSQKEWV